MMIRSNLTKIFSLFLFSACSVFINDTNDKTVTDAQLKAKNNRLIQELYCMKNTRKTLSKNGEFLAKDFSVEGNLLEQMLTHLIHEMYLNPQSFSSMPRIQFIRYENGQLKYDDFFSNQDNQNDYSIINIIHSLLKKEKNQRTAQDLLIKAHQNISASQNTSFDLANFLKENKNKFKLDDPLKTLFFKGEDPLAPFETFKTKTLSTQKNFKPLTSLNEKSLSEFVYEDKKVQCNFNLKEIQDFSSTFNNQKNIESYYFGRHLDHKNFYFVIINSKFKMPLESSNQSHLFQGENVEMNTPLCWFQNDAKSLLLTSLKGRDPGQQISHFLDYGILDSENTTDLLGHMKFTRHLFLKHPDRLLFESSKARKEQLSFYYSLNIPIYHIEKIGETIFFGSFHQKKESSFVVDERSRALLTCP